MDDGPFTRRDRHAPIAAVFVASPAAVDGLAVGRVEVDGRDATAAIIALVRGSPHWDGVRAVVLDGVAVGGFNVIDRATLARALGRPVIAVTRRPPDRAAIRLALRTYFPTDARRRWHLVEAAPLFRVPTGGRPILASAVGCTRAEAIAVLARVTVRGYWPEPLRLARLVAQAVARGPTARSRRGSATGAGDTFKRRSAVD